MTRDRGTYDRTTGNLHYGARWYDPNLGLWTQQDTLNAPLSLKTANRYGYAAGDPINNTDPAGKSLLGDVVGAVVGASVAVGICAATGVETLGAGCAVGAAVGGGIGAAAGEAATGGTTTSIATAGAVGILTPLAPIAVAACLALC